MPWPYDTTTTDFTQTGDGLMGLDTSALFGPSVLSGPGFGMTSGDPIFSTTDPNAAAFPWLSNAPDGSVFSSGASTPTMDFLNSTADSNPSGAFDFSKLLGLPSSFSLGGLGDSIMSILPDKNTSQRLLPGTMALTYAGMQPNVDVGPLNAVLGQLGGSSDAIVRAATDPLQANIAGGYGDILQSQAARGIRGSSFGDTDIANYLATTGRSLADAGASASAGSLSLQGNLAAQIAALKNQGQQIKNNLYGTAFDVLGRGLNPSGYAGNFNIGVGGGGGTVARPTDNGFLGTGISTADIGATAAIASLFSDRKLKSNIVKIAEDPRGFSLYEYDIFGERTWGVMADEVEKVMPEAISTWRGYKMVDYGRLYGR